MAEKAILFDATKCDDCLVCQVACRQWNENGEIKSTGQNGVAIKDRDSYENAPDLSPATWLTIKSREVKTGGQVRRVYTRLACLHCTDAACVRVCPNGSLYRHPLGFVAYNKGSCIGCGYCADACPFDIPRFRRNLLTGQAKMDKCTFCTTPGLDRIAAGQEPACVQTCPRNALQYGDRNTLVAAGKARVNELKAGGWSRATLYGENELGGLHVLYVLDDSPEVYGLPQYPEISAVVLAWKDFIQPVGWVVGALVILGLGMNWLVARANAKREGE